MASGPSISIPVMPMPGGVASSPLAGMSAIGPFLDSIYKVMERIGSNVQQIAEHLSDDQKSRSQPQLARQPTAGSGVSLGRLGDAFAQGFGRAQATAGGGASTVTSVLNLLPSISALRTTQTPGAVSSLPQAAAQTAKAATVATGSLSSLISPQWLNTIATHVSTMGANVAAILHRLNLPLTVALRGTPAAANLPGVSALPRPGPMPQLGQPQSVFQPSHQPPNFVRQSAAPAGGFISNMARGAMGFIGSHAGGMAAGVGATVGGVLGGPAGAAGGAALTTGIGAVISGLGNAIGGMLGPVKGAIGSVVNVLGGFAKMAVSAAGALVGLSLAAVNIAESFRKFSPNIAATFARAEAGDFLRNFRIGQAASPGVQQMMTSLGKLKDAFEPHMIKIINMMTWLATKVFGFLTDLLRYAERAYAWFVNWRSENAGNKDPALLKEMNRINLKIQKQEDEEARMEKLKNEIGGQLPLNRFMDAVRRGELHRLRKQPRRLF